MATKKRIRHETDPRHQYPGVHTLDPGQRARRQSTPLYKKTGYILDPGQRAAETAYDRLQIPPVRRHPGRARKMPLAQLAADNPNIPISGSYTLDPGQRAARTRQVTRRTTPPRAMMDPLAMSKLYNSRNRDYYSNLLMKHYGI
jgi:hypothetical protein